MINKTYIGDSVYADYDGYYIVLTTENGKRPSNVIMLEPLVFDALVEYARRLRTIHETKSETENNQDPREPDLPQQNEGR